LTWLPEKPHARPNDKILKNGGNSMKNFKRFLAITITVIMAITMCIATSLTAFADDPPFSITVTPADENDHTFEAYQIFKGDVEGAVLSNIEWGDNINAENFVSGLKGSTKLGSPNPFAGLANDASATAVAAILKDITTKSAAANEVAKIAGANLTGSPKGSANTKTGSDYVISGITNGGYYLVKDKDGSLTGTDKAYTLNLLEVVGNVTIEAKADLPSLDKNIVKADNTKAKSNTASIGDDVNFELTSAVPDMTGYDKYFYVINDTLSTGLTFNNDVAITIGSTTLTNVATAESGNTNTFSVEDLGGGRIKIVINNFIQYTKDAAITITYSAKLNQNADLTLDGNTNTVNLTYSNNPNITPTGDSENPNEPGPTDPTGITPDIQTITYTTQVQLFKVDSSGNALNGAEFTLIGDNVNQVIVVKDTFAASETGTYRKLKNGTYTTDTTLATDKYADDVLYAKTQTTEVQTKTSTTNVKAEVDANGYLVFQGLNAGDYELEESKVPGGYNKVPNIKFTISATGVTATTCTWGIALTEANSLVSLTPAAVQATKTVTTGDGTTPGTPSMLSMTITNTEGNTLPSTGGIGTKLFYLFGSLLVAGSVVLLVTKKRMAAKEN
jgi:fimbrial isopeptide formation D2 family protein/LPXTG-motif cell wall-anchored protein